MSLKGERIAVLAGLEYEDLELHCPCLRLMEDGAEVKVLAVKKEEIRGKRGLSIRADLSIAETNPEDSKCVVVPGGWAPDRLRRYPVVLDFTRKLHEGGKVIAAICHSPQVLISAGILKDRRVTLVSAIKDDVMNAGAKCKDAQS